MSNKKVIVSEKAPKAIGPYSAGIQFERLVFCSGQTPLEPKTGILVEGGIEVQTRQALTNIRGVLEAAGTSLDNVVKTTVFLTDMGEFSRMNETYAEFFKVNPPARSTIQVSALPKGASVEIEAIAIIP